MALAQTCLTAVTFMECSRGTLPSLNELVTQGIIIDRLPALLKHEWHKYKYEVLGLDGAVPFDKLASWIERQANIARSESTQVSAILPSSPTASAIPCAAPSPAVSRSVDSQVRQNVAPVQANRRPNPVNSRDNSHAAQPSCNYCQARGHQLRNCDAFAQLDAQNQREVILGLCWICLGAGRHERGDCPEKGFARHRCGCGKTHNSAIKCAAVSRQFPPSPRGGRSHNRNQAA